MIFSPIVGIMLESVGRKNSIIFGFIILVVSTMAMSVTVYCKDDILFLVLMIIARFIQGIGDMWV